MSIKAITMIVKRFEITFDCEISEAEVNWFKEQLSEEQHAVLSKSHRILLVDGFEDIYALIEELASNEFVHDIGLIREVIDYEPVYQEDDLLINWAPE